MTLDVYSKEHKKVGTLEAPESVFGVAWNANLVRQALDAYESNRRKPLAHTKGRGDVSGGGKRPYAQKHTGNARHSSIRSPLWPGGGTTFGPSNERNFTKKINRKAKRLAMLAVLSKKAKANEVFVIDDLALKEPKTKLAAAIVRAFFDKPESVLFIPSAANRIFVRAAKNLPKTTITDAASVSVYDVALRKYIIVEQSAISEIAREGAVAPAGVSAKKEKKAPRAVKTKAAPKKAPAKKAKTAKK